MLEDESEEDLRLADHYEFGLDNGNGGANVPGENLGGDTLFEVVTENLSEQIRELRDINARLTNASYEKDTEIQQLKVKLSSLNNGHTAEDTVTGAKIVELAKAKRDVTAKYESEVAKVKKLQNEKSELERKLMYSESSVVDIVARDKELNSNRRVSSSKLTTEKKPEPSQSGTDVRQLTQKLHSAVEKASLASHENACLRQQLQKVQKVLEREVGPGVDVAALLKEETPGYRGRDQLIQLLKSKLDTSKKEMEALKLFDRETAEHAPSVSNSSLCATSSWKSIGKPESNEYNQKYKKQLAHVDQKKRAEMATLTDEHEKLQKTHCELKSKTTADKARMDYLSKENTRLAQFNRHVLETCKKDAELIQYFQNTIVELREAFSKTLQSNSSPLPPLQESADGAVLKIPPLLIRGSTSGSSRRSVISRSSRSVDQSVSKKIAKMEQEIANLKQLNSLTFDELGKESRSRRSSGLRSSRSVQSVASTSNKNPKSKAPIKLSASSVTAVSKTKRVPKTEILPVSEPDKDSLGEPDCCDIGDLDSVGQCEPTQTVLSEIEQELPQFQSYAAHNSECLTIERQDLEDLRTEHSRTKESADMLQLKLSHLQLTVEAKHTSASVAKVATKKGLSNPRNFIGNRLDATNSRKNLS